MTEVKEVVRRRTQLLGDLRNRRRYWELTEETEDRNRWKLQFINAYVDIGLSVGWEY